MGILSVIGKTAAKALDTLATTVAHPIQVASAIVSPKKTVSEVTKEFMSQPLPKQVTQIVTSTAATAAVIAGGAAIGTAAKAGTLGTLVKTGVKEVIPSSTKGKVIAAVAAPAVIGAVIQAPKETASLAAKAPSELAQFGADVAKVATNPSVSSVKELVKESPIISTVAAGAAVLGAGALVTNVVSGALTRNEMEKQTEAFQRQAAAAEGLLTQAPTTSTQPALAATSATAPQTPITPATQPLIATAGSGGSGTSRRRKKRSSKPVMQNFRQNLAVVIQNRNNNTGIRASKKYLNREVLAV